MDENLSQQVSIDQLEEVLKTSDIDESLENILSDLDENLRTLEINYLALINARSN
jgi:hypothetical protein